MPKKNQAFWKEKLGKNVARDKIVNDRLKAEGWKVIRIWEHEVNDNLEGCVAKILQTFEQ